MWQALKQNNKVIVLARDAKKMLIPLGNGGSEGGQPLVDPNLTLIEGSVTNPSDVEKVFDSAIKTGEMIGGVVIALGISD